MGAGGRATQLEQCGLQPPGAESCGVALSSCGPCNVHAGRVTHSHTHRRERSGGRAAPASWRTGRNVSPRTGGADVRGGETGAWPSGPPRGDSGGVPSRLQRGACLWGRVSLSGGGCYPFSRVAMARSPGSAARWPGTGQSDHQHRHTLRCAGLLPAPQPMIPRPLPPAVLPCLSVCHSAGVKCALLLEHLVLDNLWIIANSR